MVGKVLAIRRSNGPDTTTLSGDPLDRALQALGLGHRASADPTRQHQFEDYWAEGAVIVAEDALDMHEQHVGDAAEAERDAAEESGGAERKRRAWRPARPETV
jgi:hypothetical protein